MAETRLYCKRHNDLAAPLGLCCHAAQEYNLARDDNDEFDHWSECRMMERLLVDPNSIDYEAATRVMRSWLVEDNDAPLLSAVRRTVDAALGVGEPKECPTCNGKGILGGCGRDDCDHMHTLMFCNDCNSQPKESSDDLHS